jgi:hypothetical protein
MAKATEPFLVNIILHVLLEIKKYPFLLKIVFLNFTAITLKARTLKLMGCKKNKSLYSQFWAEY